jgi:protein-disulfide isomerase
MRRFVTALVLALLPAFAWAQAAPPASGFTPAQRAEIVRIVREALKTDPSILRDAVMALQAAEGKRQEAATRGAIGAARQELLHDPADGVAGNPNGATTLVEFYDIRCPYCRHMESIVQQLLHASPGLRLVYKDLPVLGDASRLGARAMLAAGRQGGYLALHARLMRSPAPTEASLKRDAAALGLDWARMQRDMADPAIQQKIEANLALARRLGIEGTPAFVTGDQLIAGEAELAELQQAVASSSPAAK